MKYRFLVLLSFVLVSCVGTSDEAMEESEAPFMWENATVYFLLADRFYNGDERNDINFGRQPDGATLRSFMGGDIRGITKKIDDGYFDSLGVTAIWVNPLVEQVRGSVDEGTGKSYAFHGYWTRDWTALDPNFGTMADLKEMVDVAHDHGIRVLLDAVANHMGPVTDRDTVWPEDWVRTGPRCTYQSWETTVKCTLVENLPDILTENDEQVELPEFLVEKWKQEGRYDQEIKELDEFFERTGHPRAPRFYIFKWLVDYVRELGIDGFRVDTAKHTEAGIWNELYTLCDEALKSWRAENHEKSISDDDFYMVGEVYNYAIQHGRNFTYDGDTLVDFYANGYKALINFSIKWEAQQKPAEEFFSFYSDILNEGELKGKSVLNYMSSHDDGSPYDPLRNKPFETANFLFLTPGASQIYYGDETARILNFKGAEGDAHLRTPMNWDDLEANIDRGEYRIAEVLEHWRKLGTFKKEHPALGAGIHEQISEAPYIFKRTLKKGDYEDKLVVVMEENVQEATVDGVFEDGTKVRNHYTGEESVVEGGKVKFAKDSRLLLIENL